MNNASIVNLPLAIVESQDYRALNSKQQKSLSARLSYCAEVVVNSAAAAVVQDRELHNAIDDIELDALSIASNLGDVGTTVSSYIVHSSWTFETDRHALLKYVSAELVEFLATPPLRMDASCDQLRSWLERFSKMLQASLEHLESSLSFDEAITQLILVDALIYSLLTFASSARLNGNLG